MLSRVFLLKRLQRFKRVQTSMESHNTLPENLKRCFFIGLGIGTGIVATAYVVKKLNERQNSQEVVLALNRVTDEIKELRISLIHHFERTASEFSNEQGLSSTKRRYKRDDIKREILRETEALPEDESSSDDDFFDLFDDDDVKIEKESGSLQETSILNVDELLKKCDELSDNENIEDTEKEIVILEDLVIRHPDNVEVLLRCARAYKSKANFLDEYQDRKEAIDKGLEYGKKSIELDEDHPTARKWYGVLVGMETAIAPITQRVTLAHKFRKHVTKAIELNPADSTNYHLLGRWCFEVAGLSWWQRQAAAALIAEPPVSSYEEALSLFEQAHQRGFTGPKYNALYIGKCHQCLGDLEKAKEWLNKSLEFPIKDYDDKTAHEEATNIMATL